MTKGACPTHGRPRTWVPLLVTRGEHGMTLLGVLINSAIPAGAGREVFDVTGAGDTAISTSGRGDCGGRGTSMWWPWPTWQQVSWSASSVRRPSVP